MPLSGLRANDTNVWLDCNYLASTAQSFMLDEVVTLKMTYIKCVADLYRIQCIDYYNFIQEVKRRGTETATTVSIITTSPARYKYTIKKVIFAHECLKSSALGGFRVGYLVNPVCQQECLPTTLTLNCGQK